MPGVIQRAASNRLAREQFQVATTVSLERAWTDGSSLSVSLALRDQPRAKDSTHLLHWRGM